eukprot:GFKZ01000665.1.p1 GENE.GFKZ01000665.1~~GFKZ01000665.1.p1  ORF type:complete len:139 (+),score=13.38 GFKZ01000665.1:112-528(+)
MKITTVLALVCVITQVMQASANEQEHVHEHEHIIRTFSTTMSFDEAFQPKTLRVCCRSHNVIVGVVASSSNSEVMYTGTSVDGDGRCGDSGFQVVCEDIESASTTAKVRVTCSEADIIRHEPELYVPRRNLKVSKKEL